MRWSSVLPGLNERSPRAQSGPPNTWLMLTRLARAREALVLPPAGSKVKVRCPFLPGSFPSRIRDFALPKSAGSTTPQRTRDCALPEAQDLRQLEAVRRLSA
jgi:hypothetical protein